MPLPEPVSARPGPRHHRRMLGRRAPAAHLRWRAPLPLLGVPARHRARRRRGGGRMTAPAAAERVPHPAARPPLVTVEDLVKHFPLKGGAFGRKQRVHSVDHVSFTIAPKRGAGTGGRVGLRQEHPGQGHARADADRLRTGAVRRDRRRRYQGPWPQGPAPFDVTGLPGSVRRAGPPDAPGHQPRRTAGPAPPRPREERHERIFQVLGQVGLDASFLDRRPGECSGGQLQRVVVARARSPPGRTCSNAPHIPTPRLC